MMTAQHTSSFFTRVKEKIRLWWNTLTSMRVALILLFLLALAAIPGAFFPQYELNASKTRAYISEHGTWGKIMDRLQLFSVFSSFWFTAIYVLLFVSLIGCIIPRSLAHARAWKAQPPAAPRNLGRMPFYTQRALGEVNLEEWEKNVTTQLRHWRKQVVHYPDGSIAVSAEKGYLREAGNLIFHSALVALLISVGIGKFFTYSGIRLIKVGETMCSTSPSQFDSFKAGNMIDGTHLIPLCVTIKDFNASYLPTGQADQFTAHIDYTQPQSSPSSTQVHEKTSSAVLQVNHPLRVNGQRVYLLGHGYAPTITVTFPTAHTPRAGSPAISRTQTVEFKPQDSVRFLSEGAMRFDTPAGLYPIEKNRRRHQIAIEGLFAPTASFQGKLMYSSFPAPRKPQVSLNIYEGDIGLDSGLPQNVYSLSRSLIQSGQLVKKGRATLAVGQSHTLADGVKVTFDGYKQWVALQISHDPTQGWVLGSAIVMLTGLFISLTIRRRRVWVKVYSAPDNPEATLMECAGLTKTDAAGMTKEFTALCDKLYQPYHKP